MLAAVLLLAACVQQDVTPPPGPDVIGQPRELPDLPATGADPFTWSWEGGRYTLRPQVKINMDWAVFDAEDGLETVTGRYANGAELRRARFGFRGSIDEWIDFRLDGDIADGEVRDAWVDLAGLAGPGTLRFGHFREPIGLANSTPVHLHTFLERPLATALFPSRNLGVAWRRTFGPDQRGAWHVGIFRETDRGGVSEDGTGGNEVALTSRLTYLVQDEDQGRERVHLGGAFSWRNPDDGEVAFDGDAVTGIGPHLVDTGPIAAEAVYLLGLESAWIHGPNTFAAEYTYAGFDTPSGVNPGMKGWSFEAARMLTGEVRGYKKGRAALWEIEPEHPFDPESGGLGAFELGFRVSRLDLQDEGVVGGDGLNLAVAWNWHLSRFVRFQTNFVRAERENAGDVHALLFRFHFRF